jgi:excisionase family DNA binding protein
MGSKQGNRRPKKGPRKGVEHLRTHPGAYVTVSELAGYWRVSRKQIYKQIEAGTLLAIRLGPRLLRIATSEALEFERQAKMGDSAEDAERAETRVRRRR